MRLTRIRVLFNYPAIGYNKRECYVMDIYLLSFGGNVTDRTAQFCVPIRFLLALVTAVVVLGQAAPAHADGPMGRDFGLGISLGNPTSFTGKYHLSSTEAIDFHLGKFHAYGNRYWDDSLFIAGDYLFEIWNFVENGSVSVPFYAGPGLGLVFDVDDDICGRNQNCRSFDFGFGPRMPIGVGVEFQKAPFELFLEMTPTMMIVFEERYYEDDVDVRFDIPNFAFVARFYFE
jgi:hypothetical protein